jgi:hypothetical protein
VEGWLTSPALIDLIIVFTMIEAVVLIIWRRRSGAPRAFRGEGPARQGSAVGLMLLPGICLLLAVRAALAGVAWPWVPAALTAALIAHLLDVRERWGR